MMRVSFAQLSLGLACVLVVAVGCASIVSKSTYPVSISSQPSQADITITDEDGKVVYEGKTPTTVSLRAGAGYFQGKNYTVTFAKEGYGKHTADIKRGVDGWYIAGNFFFGGLIGYLIVDPLTGAMWTLPGELTVTLSPQTSSLTPGESELRVLLLDDVREDLRAKLVRIN